MIVLAAFLLLLAIVCFGLSAGNVPRANWLAIGLLLQAISFFVYLFSGVKL